MMKSIKVSPPNSLIFVMDHSFGELPEDIVGRLVSSTSTCVAVGTLSEVDGETTITLTDAIESVDTSLKLAFDGVLATPKGEVSVCNVRNEQLLTMTSSPKTYVRIYVNDDREPDQIVVHAVPYSAGK